MIGREIEGFQIIEKLGEGGMGEVYRATDTSLGRIVALKLLHTELTKDSQLTERFLSEARTQAQLNHPNLATLFRLFQFEGSYCMVMEYVDGETFGQMIRRVGPIAQERAIPLFKQALAGLAHAHHAGIIHRDIKPSNLMVNKNGIVKVMDFGIAKILGGRGLTATGVRLGTLYYMSPEQIRNQPLDIRTDIYALGITLYEMLTGRVPFDSNSDYDLMQQHIQQPPPLPRQFFPYLSPAVEDAVLQALEKDPMRRFQTAEAFSRALDEGMKGVTGAGGLTIALPPLAMDQTVVSPRQSESVFRTPTPPVTGSPPSPAPRVSPLTPHPSTAAPGTPIPGGGGPISSHPPASTPPPPPPLGPRNTPFPSPGQPTTPPPRSGTPVPPGTPGSGYPSPPSSAGPLPLSSPHGVTPLPSPPAFSPQSPPPLSGGYAAGPTSWPTPTPVPGGSAPPMSGEMAPAFPGKKNLVPLILAAVAILVVAVVVLLFVGKRFLNRPKTEVAVSVSPANVEPPQPPPPSSSSPTTPQPNPEPAGSPQEPPPETAGTAKPAESRPEVKQPAKEPRKGKTNTPRTVAETTPLPVLTPDQQAQIQQQIEAEKQRQLQQQLKEQQKSAPSPVPQQPPPSAEPKAPLFYTYRVAHSHGGFNFDQKCVGTLTVSTARMSFSPESGPHAFDVALGDVKEVKRNSGFWSIPSFHVRLKNGENYNLARFTPENRVVSGVDILTQINTLLPSGVKH
jgi:serine/threonine protein kinase